MTHEKRCATTYRVSASEEWGVGLESDTRPSGARGRGGRRVPTCSKMPSIAFRSSPPYFATLDDLMRTSATEREEETCERRRVRSYARRRRRRCTAWPWPGPPPAKPAVQPPCCPYGALCSPAAGAAVGGRAFRARGAPPFQHRLRESSCGCFEGNSRQGK